MGAAEVQLRVCISLTSAEAGVPTLPGGLASPVRCPGDAGLGLTVAELFHTLARNPPRGIVLAPQIVTWPFNSACGTSDHTDMYNGASLSDSCPPRVSSYLPKLEKALSLRLRKYCPKRHCFGLMSNTADLSGMYFRAWGSEWEGVTAVLHFRGGQLSLKPEAQGSQHTRIPTPGQVLAICCPPLATK